MISISSSVSSFRNIRVTMSPRDWTVNSTKLLGLVHPVPALSQLVRILCGHALRQLGVFRNNELTAVIIPNY